jgi:hypothetical protein
MRVWVLMGGCRTGSRAIDLSTAGFSVVAAAGLPLDHTQRDIAREQPKLAWPGHGLIEVGEKGVPEFVSGGLRFRV